PAAPLFILVHFPLLFSTFRAPRPFHSFPTRRSSDLRCPAAGCRRVLRRIGPPRRRSRPARRPRSPPTSGAAGEPRGRAPGSAPRSEEHTSELQSRFDLVCRLLHEQHKPYISCAATYP